MSRSSVQVRLSALGVRTMKTRDSAAHVLAPALVVCGTNTGVGKTRWACALARSAVARGDRVGVIKAVETGCTEVEGAMIATDAQSLQRAAGGLQTIEEVCRWRFPRPVTPAAEFRRTGTSFDDTDFAARVRSLRARTGLTIVESAGGICSPLDRDLVAGDLARIAGLPAVLVAENTLGTLSVTIASREAALHRGIRLVAVLLNRRDDREPDPSHADNAAWIRECTGLPVWHYGGEELVSDEVLEAVLALGDHAEGD